MNRTTTMATVAAAFGFLAMTRTAVAQNDWQFPDPYFGAFQHRAAGTPQAERRYRAEIAPQQPLRLSDLHANPATGGIGTRWRRHRGRRSPVTRSAGTSPAPTAVTRPVAHPPPAQPPPAPPRPGP